MGIPNRRLTIGSNRRVTMRLPWNPTYSTTYAWYDASNANSITSLANAVSQWLDLSGQGNHMTQGTGSKQPFTNIRTQNGLNVLDFDNAAGQFLHKLIPVGIPDDSFDIYMIMKKDVVTDQYLLTVDGPAPTQIRSGRYGLGTDGSLDTGGGSWELYQTADTDVHLLNIRWNGAVVQNFIDGVQVGTDDAAVGVLTIDEFINLCADAFGSNTHDGFVAELVYADYKAEAERQQMEAYLMWKWGLSSEIPSSSPYLNEVPFVPNRRLTIGA